MFISVNYNFPMSELVKYKVVTNSQYILAMINKRFL